MIINIDRISKNSFSRKAVILFYICLSALVVLVPLTWLFDKIQISWGDDAAVVSLTMTFIVVIVIVVSGMVIGLCVDYAIRHRKFIFRSATPGYWLERTIKMWGYNLTDLPENEAKLVSANPEAIAKTSYTGKPIPEKAKRRGRKPAFPLPRWMEVAMVWELRDPNFDIFSLSDVISQKLGVTANGEPIIGDGAYYATWRILAIREINRLELTKIPLSEDLRSGDKVERIIVNK